MVTTTLKCLVLKTETVSGVKLPTPADRIGTGAMVDFRPPANFLSPGLFLESRLSTQNRVGPRQGFPAMRYEPTTVVPTSLVGSFSGTSACRRWAAKAVKRVDWADHPWSSSAHPGSAATANRPTGRTPARTEMPGRHGRSA